MKLIILGAPGAGKGTQAKIISDKLNIPHVSTGDIFRVNIKENTELGKKAKEFMDSGLLVPDELVIELVIDRLNKEDCNSGFILDGYPRTIPQAEALDQALFDMESKIDFAIEIVVPDEVIVRRMAGRRACVSCGATYHIVNIPPTVEGKCDRCNSELILREDDKAETVLKRLDIYSEQTKPLIDYYKNQEILKSFDGTKDIYKTTEDILKSLGV